MENMLISGVTKKSDIARITVKNLAEKSVAFHIFGLLQKENINVDIILQSAGENGRSVIDFTVDLPDAAQATEMILRAGLCAPEDVECNENVAKVSVVGTGMQSHHGAAGAIFEAVYKENVDVLMLSSSELRISLVVRREDADRTVRAIHGRFINI